MKEKIFVKGIVLKSAPAGEQDKRVTLFTEDRGKVTAFASGARRSTSTLGAATEPFSFGTFSLLPGKSAYHLVEAQIANYFEELRTDLDRAYYGMFFLELADYYTRENNEDAELLKLLYQSLKALGVQSLNNQLVRCVFELKALMTEGEYPGPEITGTKFDEGTLYTLSFIERTPVQSLYTFTVSDKVLTELTYFVKTLRARFLDRPFHALQMLATVETFGYT